MTGTAPHEPGPAPDSSRDPVRVRTALVVRGGWPGHRPVETTEAFIGFLDEQGFAVQVHDLHGDEGPTPYADPDRMAGIDLILQCVSMDSITTEQVLGLRAAVAAGTGLAGWHGGIVDSYRTSHEYQQLIGGLFAFHPGSESPDAPGTRDNGWPTHRYRVVDADHPVTAGLADFDLVTEQYWVLNDDYCDVLVTTTQSVLDSDEWSRPVTSPAVWTRTWGVGRIFVATPGHDLATLADPNVRSLIERGLIWAAR